LAPGSHPPRLARCALRLLVPIFAKKVLAAELDVESYFANTFSAAEQEFIEATAAIVAGKVSLPAGARVVAIVSGGNVDPDRALSAVGTSEVSP